MKEIRQELLDDLLSDYEKPEDLLGNPIAERFSALAMACRSGQASATVRIPSASEVGARISDY